MATAFEVLLSGLVALVGPRDRVMPPNHLIAILVNPQYSNKYSSGNGVRIVEEHFPRLTVPIRLKPPKTEHPKDTEVLTAHWDDAFPPDEMVVIPGSDVQFATWNLSGKTVSIDGAKGPMKNSGLKNVFSTADIGISDTIFRGYSMSPPSPGPGEDLTPVVASVALNGGSIETSDSDEFRIIKDSNEILGKRTMAVEAKWTVRVETKVPTIHVKKLNGERIFDITYQGNLNLKIPIAVYNLCHCNVPPEPGTTYHFKAFYDLLARADRPDPRHPPLPDQNHPVSKPGGLRHCSPLLLLNE